MAIHLVTGHAGAEHVTGADQGSFNIGVIGAGQYVIDRGSKFAASIYSNNIVRIADGDLIMQGRHIRQKEKTYEECVFENGTQGMLRNDLICVRYTKDDSTGAERAEFAVIKGQEAAQNPTDPTPVSGDITEEGDALVNEMPLYRVSFVGLTMQEPVPLYSLIKNYNDYVEESTRQCEELRQQVNSTNEALDKEDKEISSMKTLIEDNKKRITDNSKKINAIEEACGAAKKELEAINLSLTNIKNGTEPVEKANNAENAKRASAADEAATSEKLKKSVKIGDADFDGSKDVSLKDMGIYKIKIQNTEPTEIEDNTIVFVYEE